MFQDGVSSTIQTFPLHRAYCTVSNYISIILCLFKTANLYQMVSVPIIYYFSQISFSIIIIIIITIILANLKKEPKGSIYSLQQGIVYKTFQGKKDLEKGTFKSCG